MTAFKLITPPSVEPVTLSEAKAHARIETTNDDALITSLITAARLWAEQYTNRAFITQGWQLWLDTFPANNDWWDGMREGAITNGGLTRSVALPRAPLIAVNSVQSYDAADSATLWAASNYYVDTLRDPGRLVLRPGAVWPFAARGANGICIDYSAGYGANASSVPEAIKTAIRQLIAHWYENRGEVWSEYLRAPREMPMVIETLLEPYRVRYSGV